MQKTILHISLKVRGPLISQSSNPGELGLDMVIARNHKNQIYLPGTLISGKIRQALEELNAAMENETKPEWFAPKLNDWLGQGSEEDFFARTKRLFFSDFILAGDEPGKNTRYRIKIDAERGAVAKHQIVMIESPFISGETYIFTGQVHFFSSEKTAQDIKLHLNAALKWFSHLGAFRAIGFGQVESAEISAITKHSIPEPQPVNENKENTRVAVCIHPDYPFCLPGKPKADNLFASEAIIPGGAIKGCIATTWNHLLDKQSGKIDFDGEDFKALRENFSKLRIAHAFPGHIENTRPVVAPLSLVKVPVKESPLYDVAQLSGPALICGLPPDFAVDWKDTDKTLDGYPWPYIRFKDWSWESLESELRIRTAIDRDALRSAEEQLFAYQQIAPDKLTDNGWTTVNWYSELDLSQLDGSQQSVVLAQLKALCAYGLIGLGKTKTPLQIHFLDPADSIKPAIPNHFPPLENNTWLLTLQTDTLLGSPDHLNETSGKQELHDMYAAAWHDISKQKLTLLRYFARQRISGGKHRQQAMGKKDDTYRPWLLTEAGSVFVLQATDTDTKSISEMLEDWVYTGLPLSQSTIAWYRLGSDKTQHWQYTPFVPENGYGEIAVNLPGKNVIALKDNDKSIQRIEG